MWCLTGQRTVPGPYEQACTVKDLRTALDLFNIPRPLWPMGVRYYDEAERQREEDQANGQKFLKALQSMLDCSWRLFRKEGWNAYKIKHEFYLYKRGIELELLDRPTKRSLSDDLQSWSFHPKQLAIDLAAAEQLHTEFEDEKLRRYTSKLTVTIRNMP